MTKQDEIKEGVADFCRVMRAEGILRHYTPQSDADGILEFLHDQGVVIKVDRELPLNPHLVEVLSGFGKAAEIYYKAQQRILKAGYVAVAPLIAEK